MLAIDPYASNYYLGISALTPLDSASSTIAGASTPAPVSTAAQVELSGLGQLLSAISTFQTSLWNVQPTADSFGVSTTSSNSTVANAYAQSTATSATYNIDVTNLAQGQTLESSGYTDAANTVVGSGILNIQNGSYNNGTFTPSGNGTQVSISNGTLTNIANAINSSGANVGASISEDSNGLYHLVLTNPQTGSASTLKISVTDNDGNNTDTSGLSNLTYDPAGTQNLSVAQAGTNAQFVVNGVSEVSSANSGVNIGAGVTATLGGTGTTSIAVTTDNTSVQNASQTLVNAFNTLQTTVNSLRSDNAALAGNPIASLVSISFDGTAQASYNNGGSSLTQIGDIGINYVQPAGGNLGALPLGGTLSLNNDTLQVELNQQGSSVASLLAQAIQGLQNNAEEYGSAGGLVPETISDVSQQAYSDRLVSTPLQVNLPPTAGQLAAEQTGSIRLSSTQITGLQQYATVAALLQPLSVDQILISGLVSSGDRDKNTTTSSSSNSAISLFA